MFISERSSLLIGVVCAKGMGRTWLPFSSLSYSKGPLVYVFLFFGFFFMAYSVKDLLVCRRGGFKGHQITNMWNAIPLCLMWCIWNEHNSRSFEGIESLLHLKSIFLISLCDWLKIIWDFSCSCLWFFDLCNLYFMSTWAFLFFLLIKFSVIKKSFHFSIFMGNHILC